MEYLILALSILSLILHFIGPKTKTKADDLAAEAVDVVKASLEAKPTAKK